MKYLKQNNLVLVKLHRLGDLVRSYVNIPSTYKKKKKHAQKEMHKGMKAMVKR